MQHLHLVVSNITDCRCNTIFFTSLYSYSHRKSPGLQFVHERISKFASTLSKYNSIHNYSYQSKEITLSFSNEYLQCSLDYYSCHILQ